MLLFHIAEAHGDTRRLGLLFPLLAPVTHWHLPRHFHAVTMASLQMGWPVPQGINMHGCVVFLRARAELHASRTLHQSHQN